MTETPELIEAPRDLDLIRTYVESGRPIAEAKELFDFVKQVRAEDAKKAFTRAMVACQAEMPTIIRDKTNNQTNKAYAPLETIKTWAKPHFIRHNFALSFTTEAGQEPGLTTVHLDVTHVDGHTQRSTIPNMALDNEGPKGGAVKTLVQGMMSTLSYAQGRLIVLAFNLTVADEDRDGQAGWIAPDQVSLINDSIEACRQAGKWDEDRSLKTLCRVYQIDNLGELPANRLRDVLADLDRQLTGKVKK